MSNKYKGRKRAWIWNIHGGKILEHVGAFLECFRDED
jgi:hypothetical protein